MILYYFRIRSPVGRKIQIEHVKIYRTSPPQSTITQLKAFIEPSMKSLDSTLQRNYSMVERVFYRCDSDSGTVAVLPWRHQRKELLQSSEAKVGFVQ